MFAPPRRSAGCPCPPCPLRPPSARRAPPASVHGTMTLRAVTADFSSRTVHACNARGRRVCSAGTRAGLQPGQASRPSCSAGRRRCACPPARPRSSPCARDHAAAAYIQGQYCLAGARTLLVVRSARAWLGKGGHAPSGRAPPCPRCRTDGGRGARE